MSHTPSPFWLRYTPKFVQRRLEGRTSLHAIIHNTGWLLGDKILRLGMGLLVGAWVARYLGPSEYGSLSYVIAFVAFFQIISQLGLDEIVIRDMSRNHEDSHVILGTVFRLRLLTGFIGLFCAIGLMALLRPGDISNLVLTAIVAGGIVFQSADTVDLWFQSQMQSKRTVAAKTVSYLINNLIKVLLILYKAPLLFFGLTFTTEFFLAAIALSISYRKHPSLVRWKSDVRCGKRLLKESWPYLVSGIAVIVYMRIDQIMIRQMLGTHDLGYFTAAVSLSSSLYFLPRIMTQSVAPAIAKKKKDDIRGYENTINKLFFMMWWVMLPASLIIYYYSEFIIYIVFGDAYMQSAKILAVHVFASVPVSLGFVQSLWIVNEKKNLIILIKTISGALTNVLLNIFMIPKYGVYGAALATVASQAVSGVLVNIFIDPKMFRRQLCCIFFIK